MTTITSEEFTAAGLVLGRTINTLAHRASTVTGVRPEYRTDAPDDWTSLQEAGETARRCGRLAIYSGASDTAIYGRAINLAFRFWHDLGHLEHDRSFTGEDERALQYAHHLAEVELMGIERGSLPHRMYLADTCGQIDYVERWHHFPTDQRAFVRAYVLDPADGIASHL